MSFNIPSASSLTNSFHELRLRSNFGADARIQFYEALALLQENGVKQDDALNELYNVYSDDGKNPKAPLAVIVRHLIDGLKAGIRFSVSLQRFVSYTECSLIAGGEVSGDMKGAFEHAVRVITKQREIMGAVAMATLYPGLLAAMSVFLINMVSTQLVPKFARMSNPDNWEGSARVLYLMGKYVTNYGAVTLAVLVAMLIAVLVSMPYLRGQIRVALDRLFPWSLYRMLYGSTFLLNVAVMVGAGVPLREALESLAKNSNPWLRERIEGALYGIVLGHDLGLALKNSGFEFPDRTAIRYLQLISNQQGFAKDAARFGERWMDESVKKAKVLGKFALSAGIAVIGGLMILIMSGANGITETINAVAK